MINSSHLPSAESLGGYRRTVAVEGSGWRRARVFLGPAVLVSVGYMDPGNWATDLAAGSRYGMTLLWVVLASSLAAIVLQTLSVRLAVATGRDLAQACRAFYPVPLALGLYALAEVAIVATDVAEVIGSAVALKLLFGMPLLAGVLVTALDTVAVLALMRLGFRKLEAFVAVLVGTVFVCFLASLGMARPDVGSALMGMSHPVLPNGALFLALGILGATVMPHNLYLHSAVVQTRAWGESLRDKAAAARNATWDTVGALGAAFFVNAAILILAATALRGSGPVTELEQAHRMLIPALGGLAAGLFAIALLAAGQSSTVTGTLAGQVVMEGFLHLRMPSWARRLLTRGLALVPAVWLVLAHGGHGSVQLLVLSQVVLSLQLPFAIVPLVAFTASRKRMGELVNPLWLSAVGAALAVLITGLNVWLLAQTALGNG